MIQGNSGQRHTLAVVMRLSLIIPTRVIQGRHLYLGNVNLFNVFTLLDDKKKSDINIQTVWISFNTLYINIYNLADP